MIIVKKGNEEGRLGVAHWWPTRSLFDWTHNSPIPTHVRRTARGKGTKYLTMVSVNFPTGQLVTFASCCPKDIPTREAGRFIALLRMGRLLKSMGLKWERV